ncbi:MAG: hypothetical protein R3314_05005 [Longimicrobiales bacterium]|nr:hypothetical protein [Longimicrobiales bacterium]
MHDHAGDMSDTTETRQNPYQLVFGAESIDDRLFPPIEEEAEARDQPLDDPERFLFLSSVGQLLQAIAAGKDAGYDHEPAEGVAKQGAEPEPGAEAEPGAGAEPEPEPDTADREELKQYGRLLYHAFHYWRDRKPTRRVDEDSVRWLLDEVTSVGEWSLTVPSSSGYLQLPRNLIWAEPAPGLTPEPVDGFFWRWVEPEDEPARLHVLLVLGVRPDRAGFSVVPATGILDDEDHWAEVDARPDGPDFETTLPGGEMDALYSIETAAEVLKLASLCFWKLDPAAG